MLIFVDFWKTKLQSGHLRRQSPSIRAGWVSVF